MPLPSSSCQSARNSAYRYDGAVKRVVIAGADSGGWSAAKAVRHLHPACEIYVIGEKDPLVYLQHTAIHRNQVGKNKGDVWTAYRTQPLIGKSYPAAIRWMNSRVTRIEANSRKIHLTDGSSVGYDRLILSTNGQCCAESTFALAQSCGLRINCGILVDSWMRTSDPFTFAIGNLAELDERIAPFSLLTISQAEVAATSAVAGPGVSLIRHFALSQQVEFYIH